MKIVEPAWWAQPVEELLSDLGSTVDGLREQEAQRRLDEVGPNEMAPPHRHRGLRLLVAQFESPIMVILVTATVLSMVLGDLTDGAIILGIIAASGGLGFWQEHGAGQAVDALLDQVRVDVEVLRDRTEVAVPAAAIVPGDVVVLRAGDIVPADCRVFESRDLLVDEAAMTGEAYPVEKAASVLAADAAPSGRTNSLFLGTHVVSGSGRAVVVRTGRDTEFGDLVAELATREVKTRFERGLTAFGRLLLQAMAVLVTVILVVNIGLGRPLIDAVLFSLALAVGLTPQLLPAVVAVSLSTGARHMAAERVIVKRLDAIEDLGSMTVLCTDKTGTLTVGAARLHAALDLTGTPDDDVLRLAQLNAGLQRGFANPLDAAVVDGATPPDPSLRLDEIPYDFGRRRLSILADVGTPTLITKGAVADVVAVSSTARIDGVLTAIDVARPQITDQFEALSSRGHRVLAVAVRPLPRRETVTIRDEAGMTLVGLLAFADPAKPDARAAVVRLGELGVSVRMVTGDNRLAAAKVAADVGLDASRALTGSEIRELSDDQLHAVAGDADVFAEVQPLDKERVIRALRAGGATVGYLGDGINDSAALHAADVGISVDTAVDVAKQSAAIVLLDKDLGVLADGIELGRRTFANTIKYIRVTTSANFGNMLSMAAAAAFLPFLPLLPRQILLLNFLSDIPATTIAGDDVDPEQLTRPSPWDIRSIRGFMVVFGLISTGFDLATFLILRLGFDTDADLFRSSWFVLSTATELTAMLVLRTRRPFWRSRPATPLLVTSGLIAVITVAIPYSAAAAALGLVAIPARVLAALAAIAIAYVITNEAAKHVALGPLVDRPGAPP